MHDAAVSTNLSDTINQLKNLSINFTLSIKRIQLQIYVLIAPPQNIDADGRSTRPTVGGNSFTPPISPPWIRDLKLHGKLKKKSFRLVLGILQ